MATIPGSQPDDSIIPSIVPPIIDLSPDSDSSSPPPPSNDSPPPPPSDPPADISPSPPPPSPPPPNSPPPESPPPSPPSESISPPSPSQSQSQSPPSPPPSKSSPPPPSPRNSPPPASPPPSPPDSPPPEDSPPAASPPPPSLTPSPPAPPDSSPDPPPPDFSPPPPVNSVSPRSPASTPPAPPTSTPSPGTGPPTSTTPPRPPTFSPSPPGSPTDTSPHTGSALRPPSNSGSSDSSVSVNSVHSSPPDNDQTVTTGVAIGVVVGVFVLGLVLVFIFLQRRRKKHTRYNSVYMMPSPYASSPASGTSYIKPNDSGTGTVGSDYVDGTSKAWFSYEELSAAAGGFATQNILGRGGFGCVYKGCLQDGREVAIKKLKDNSGQGDREFKAEVEIISRVHHRYLVSLVGYCITDFQRLLVYEFVPNGTLHYHLHNPSKPAMQWNLRVKVACGSARGIAYLHEDCHPRIIHRDIKSANILIDNNIDAKVADFGLAKIAQELESNTHVSTRVMGTFGYMAPEYASSGKLTEKSDVFSFGVVLLEIISGRKPVDESRPLGEESLVEWARPLMSDALDKQNFDELADPRLQGNYDRGEMFRMIEAAAACVRHSAVKRPRMSQVVRALDTMNELSDISNGMKPGQSEIYDSREQSAQIRLFQRMAFGSQEFSSEQHQSMSMSQTQSSWSSGGRSGLARDSSGQV